MKSRNFIAVAALAFLALAAALFPELVPMLNTDGGTLSAGLAGAPMILGDTVEVRRAIADLEENIKKFGGNIKDFASETKARLLALEQGGARKAPLSGSGDQTPGQLVAESAEFKAIRPGDRNMAPVQVTSFHSKTAIVNATGLNQPLVAADRVAGIVASQRLLRVRDLLPVVPTSSNMIEFCRVLSEDIEASPQYSSPNPENVPKKESALTFELANEPVVTLAHWIPASRQVLSDSAMLAGFVDTRLRYGVALAEERQILNGTAAGGDLNGIIGQAAAYSGATSGDTLLDTLMRALNQVTVGGNYSPSGAVLHPNDVLAALLLKDGQERYLLEGLQALSDKLGVPVVASQYVAQGTFLVGAFNGAAAIYDREDATVRVAEQHADFFVKNMVAILAEERLALVVYDGTGFVTGNL
jgi:HK97 family phage major capsid protein